MFSSDPGHGVRELVNLNQPALRNVSGAADGGQGDGRLDANESAAERDVGDGVPDIGGFRNRGCAEAWIGATKLYIKILGSSFELVDKGTRDLAGPGSAKILTSRGNVVAKAVGTT